MEISKKNHYKKCEICKEQAMALCFTCYSYYCDECFKYVHDKKENKNHKKEVIDYFAPIDTKCPLHNGNIVNLFCLEDKGNS